MLLGLFIGDEGIFILFYIWALRTNLEACIGDPQAQKDEDTPQDLGEVE